MSRGLAIVFFCGLLAGCGRPSAERVEWPVMGTVAAVQVRGAGVNEIRTVVQRELAAVERLLNAHDPQSELSHLAKLPEAEILARCDPRMRPCYAAAFALAAQSDREFNPRWRGEGTLDLGAIAKGFAVDVAAAAIATVHPRSEVLIDLGGNLKAVRGSWRVGVSGGETEFTLAPGAACATSGTYFRGAHIKDGRTGAAVANDWHSVTVVHPSSAMLADGLSTTLFILGRSRGEEFLRQQAPGVRAIWESENVVELCQ